MGVFSLYSKRRRKKEKPDTLSYDELPPTFRTQVLQICVEVFGNETDWYFDQFGAPAYRHIVGVLRKERGVFCLTQPFNIHPESDLHELATYFLNETDVELALDVVELIFCTMDTSHARDYIAFRRPDSEGLVDGAISELNQRFLEAGLGYRLENGQLVRIDSTLLHEEVTKSTLALLTDSKFAGANEEFMRAHEHYYAGRCMEAIGEASKALESALKIICRERGWKYGPKDGASKLIGICFDNGLIPEFWQSNMAALRALLEGGVPPARNALSGHGQGEDTIKVPQHIAGFVLHMAAAAICFLVEAHQNARGG